MTRWTNKETVKPEVGMGASRPGYSDVEPYTIVEVRNEKTIVAKACESTLDPNWKPEVEPGGFAGHCVNNSSQQWIINPEPQEDASKEVYTLRKNGKWVLKGSPMTGTYLTIGRRTKFYDYNF